MATDDLTDPDDTTTSTVMDETMGKLRELIDEARHFRAAQLADLGDASKRATFIAWSERTATARGFLECLVTLNLLSQADEVAWYEYLGGERDSAPDTEG